jgi:signal transduction histidine kinase/predicted hydrocarbon binding protein
MKKSEYEIELENKILNLEIQLEKLKKSSFNFNAGKTVSVPEQFKESFINAEKTVHEYFKSFAVDPSRASIEIGGQRYLLMRAASLSIGFFNTLAKLYPDKNEEEVLKLTSTFLFDIAHVIGLEDAKVFHQEMKVSDPIAKLSAGPVHFAFSGWAFVEINPESNPVADENFILKYSHPYSFEADSWIKEGKKSSKPVCFMNSGYSSGWCEESFGIKLTAVELTCKACGDEKCTFVMAPPDKIKEYLSIDDNINKENREDQYHVPAFFKRKEMEDEMRVARNKAEDSDKAKSEFLANMSHEMRTPLSAIQGYINLMQKEQQSEINLNYLDIISQSSNHLLKLVDDILDLSKIEARQLVIYEDTFCLKDLLSESYDTALRMLEKLNRNLVITWKLDSGISDFIIGDSVRIKQVMYNLLTNAIKFTVKGEIHFEVQKLVDNTLLFIVKDTGIGISSEKQKTIFNMFDQVDASQTREFGGAGLGLNISRKIVDLLNGSMWVESKLGLGSAFYFKIPYLSSDNLIKPVDKTMNVNIEIGIGKKVLLVEDNLFNHQMIGFVLENYGFRVHKSFNGKEAVDYYCSGKYIDLDLIVMDVQMPIMDGLSATKIIRDFEKQNKLKAISIVALTASAMQRDREKCIEVGCDFFLTKPISPDDFILEIANILKFDD